MDCSPPGSSVDGILQARVLEYALLQGILPTQGSNPGLPLQHWQVGSLPLVSPGKPLSPLLSSQISSWMLLVRRSSLFLLVTFSTLGWSPQSPLLIPLRVRRLGGQFVLLPSVTHPFLPPGVSSHIYRTQFWSPHSESPCWAQKLPRVWFAPGQWYQLGYHSFCCQRSWITASLSNGEAGTGFAPNWWSALQPPPSFLSPGDRFTLAQGLLRVPEKHLLLLHWLC